MDALGFKAVQTSARVQGENRKRNDKPNALDASGTDNHKGSTGRMETLKNGKQMRIKAVGRVHGMRKPFYKQLFRMSMKWGKKWGYPKYHYKNNEDCD